MVLRNWSDIPDRDADEPAGPPAGDQSIVERDLEAPEADIAEQDTPAAPADEADEEPPLTIIGFLEANEADAVEQRRVVAYEDDYRP